MTMRINPPDFKSKSYERYKRELEAWKQVTEVDKKKQGIAIALSLPEEHESGIREKVFDEIDLGVLNADDGLAKLVEFLDQKLGKDELSDSLKKFEDFEDFCRDSKQSIVEYIANFDQKYNRLEKLDMKLPPAILAFKLLRKANISTNERLLVLTGMNYAEKDRLYEQAKASLIKFKGKQGTGCSSGDNGASAIKLEPTCIAEHEHALIAAGYSVYRGVPRSSYRGGRNARGNRWKPRGSSGRHVNPTGMDGKAMLCNSCGSYRHMMINCPDSWENMGNRDTKVNIVEQTGNYGHGSEQVVLFTGFQRDSLREFTKDAQNCIVLDSACSSNVCGREWMDTYLETLSPNDRSKVVQVPGHKVFKFGGGERLTSQSSLTIPGQLAGKPVMINTDVVESDIPLLMSKDAMKRAKIKLNLENDTAEVFGVPVSLNLTSSGHYCLPIDKAGNIPLENVCVVLQQLDEKGKRETLIKLHRQFAHPTEEKLVSLLKDANVWSEDLKPILTELYVNCQMCKTYKKTPPRPVVAMPMAQSFNEKVAIDLKKWGDDGWLLHMIDMWSRLSVSTVIKRKLSSVIIDNIMKHWIGVFGIMTAILSDNGGEFNSDEMQEVCSILNVEHCTTAAYSPFQNGLCERNHAVVDSILLRLKEQYPKYDLETLLCWANMVKNSLQMWNGYSSYQLVLGRNPSFPNITSATPPALEGVTHSESLAKHLNTLHATRKAFIESETCERIRRALRSKIRASEQSYKHGDRVYYKRDGQDKWIGPGKVVFQDSKVVFVRHGGVFVRVSPNRLIKAGQEFVGENDVTQHSDISTDNNDQTNDENQDDSVHEEIGNSQTTTVEPINVNVNFKKNDRISFKTDQMDTWNDATILSRAGKAQGTNKYWFNIHNETTGNNLSVDLSRVPWKRIDTPNVEVVNITNKRITCFTLRHQCFI